MCRRIHYKTKKCPLALFSEAFLNTSDPKISFSKKLSILKRTHSFKYFLLKHLILVYFFVSDSYSKKYLHRTEACLSFQVTQNYKTPLLIIIIIIHHNLTDKGEYLTLFSQSSMENGWLFLFVDQRKSALKMCTVKYGSLCEHSVFWPVGSWS